MRNRLRKLSRRVRQPRYLLGALVAVAYFGWLLWMQLDRGAGRGGGLGPAGGSSANLWAIPLLGFLAYLSVVGPGSAGLLISAAEAQFLLPAPISRRDLIRYKFAQALLPLLFSAGLFTLLTASGGVIGVGRKLIGFWMVALVMQLVRTRASIFLADARRLDISLIRRAPVLPVASLLLIGALATHLALSMIGSVDMTDLGAALAYLPEWASGPIPSLLLTPVRVFTLLFSVSNPLAWIATFAAASALVGGLYLRVIRIDVPFEEASLETAERLARMREAVGRGGGLAAIFGARGREKARKRTGSRAPFRIAIPRRGPPEIVFFWKNVLAFARHPLSRTLRYGPPLVIAIAAIAAFVTGRPDLVAGTTAGMLGLAGAYILAIGPLAIRNDLRGDLVSVELLRTYPVAGYRFVAASVGGSVATLLFIEMVIVAMAAGFLAASGTTPIPTPLILAGIPAAPLALLPAISISLLLHNLVALYFPAWFRPGLDRGRGLEAMGLRIVASLGGIALLAVAVGVPGLAGFVAAAPLWVAIGPWALIPGAGTFLVVVAGEIALAVSAMGRRWDRLDPGEVAPVE